MGHTVTHYSFHAMRYCLYFLLLFCLLVYVLKGKGQIWEVCDERDWGAQYETHKESIKSKTKKSPLPHDASPQLGLNGVFVSLEERTFFLAVFQPVLGLAPSGLLC